MNLTVYIREKDYFFLDGRLASASGVFSSSADAERLLDENRVRNVFLVFSRPKVFFRTLNFSLTSLKKIALVIEGEIAGLFPVPLQELDIHWHPIRKDKDGFAVLVCAIERKLLAPWEQLRKKYHFRLTVGFESSVIMNTLEKSARRGDCSALFADHNYLAYYRLRDGIMTGGFSCFPEKDHRARFVEFQQLSGSPENVYYFGNQRLEADFPDVQSVISVPGDEETGTVFFKTFAPFSAQKISVPFKTYRTKPPRTIFHPGLILAGIVYLGIVFYLVRPVFLEKKLRRQLDYEKARMEDVFRRTFPDVTNIVNPLAQARERLKVASPGNTPVRISPVAIMAKIAQIVPEQIPFKVFQLTANGQNLFLSCQTDGLKQIDLIGKKFMADSFFSDVKISGISFTAGGVNFTISAKLQNE
jgi:hypothetical protein